MDFRKLFTRQIFNSSDGGYRTRSMRDLTSKMPKPNSFHSYYKNYCSKAKPLSERPESSFSSTDTCLFKMKSSTIDHEFSVQKLKKQMKIQELQHRAEIDELKSQHENVVKKLKKKLKKYKLLYTNEVQQLKEDVNRLKFDIETQPSINFSRDNVNRNRINLCSFSPKLKNIK